MKPHILPERQWNPISYLKDNGTYILPERQWNPIYYLKDNGTPHITWKTMKPHILPERQWSRRSTWRCACTWGCWVEWLWPSPVQPKAPWLPERCWGHSSMTSSDGYTPVMSHGQTGHVQCLWTKLPMKTNWCQPNSGAIYTLWGAWIERGRESHTVKKQENHWGKTNAAFI